MNRISPHPSRHAPLRQVTAFPGPVRLPPRMKQIGRPPYGPSRPAMSLWARLQDSPDRSASLPACSTGEDLPNGPYRSAMSLCARQEHPPDRPAPCAQPLLPNTSWWGGGVLAMKWVDRCCGPGGRGGGLAGNWFCFPDSQLLADFSGQFGRKISPL